MFFRSYVIQFMMQEISIQAKSKPKLKKSVSILKLKNPEYKKMIKIFEGPRNYIHRLSSFHFYDAHNHYLYCIIDSDNIFADGIKFQYYDVAHDSGHFKEGLLRFACASKEQFTLFSNLMIPLKFIYFCVEAQHGVFILMAASKNYIFHLQRIYSFQILTLNAFSLQPLIANLKTSNKIFRMIQ